MIKKPYIFICHRSDCNEAVKELEAKLQENDITYWDYEEQMLPGDSIFGTFPQALKRADLVVLVISPQFDAGGSVAIHELNQAMKRQSELRKLYGNEFAFVIPFITSKDVKVPIQLEGIFYAYTTEKVVQAIQAHREKFMPNNNSYSFSNWPKPLVSEGKVDATIIIGHSGKECKPEEWEISALMPHYDPSVECRPQSQRIPEYLPYLVKFLDSAANLQRVTQSAELDESFQCHVDWHAIKFHGARLRETNIISLGAGDTNLISRWILSTYPHLPIRFDSSAGSQTLYCDAAGKVEAAVIDSVEADMHKYGALLLIVPNPLNQDKVAVVAAGLTALGTQAAILALSRNPNELRLGGAYKGNYIRILIGEEKDWRAVNFRFLR